MNSSHVNFTDSMAAKQQNQQGFSVGMYCTYTEDPKAYILVHLLAHACCLQEVVIAKQGAVDAARSPLVGLQHPVLPLLQGHPGIQREPQGCARVSIGLEFRKLEFLNPLTFESSTASNSKHAVTYLCLSLCGHPFTMHSLCVEDGDKPPRTAPGQGTASADKHT